MSLAVAEVSSVNLALTRYMLLFLYSSSFFF